MTATSHTKALVAVFIVGAIAVILGCVLGFVVLPNIVENEIKDNSILLENTLQWYRFKEIPFPFKFSTNFFTIENPYDVLNGVKPKVKERGPYVYNEKKIKQIDSIEKDSIVYKDVWTFEFDQKASGKNTEDDLLLVMNSPLFTLYQSLEELPFALPYSTDEIVRDIFENTDVFMRVKVRNYAFEGIPMCDSTRSTTGWSKLVCLVIMLLNQKPIDYLDNRSMLFSLFGYKKKLDGPFEANRGIKDLQKLGLITKYKNKEYTEYWKGKQSSCDKVEGHYSSFPPFVEKNTIKKVYSTDICKSGVFNYKGERTFKNVPSYRFSADAEAFASANETCVCIDATKGLDGEGHCYSKGVLDLNTCFGGVPVVMSFPHLMWADNLYRNTIDGLQSDYNESYTTMIDLEPHLGFPINGAVRIQFNMVMRPIKYANQGFLQQTETLPRALFPLLWISETFEFTDALLEELDSKLLNQLVLIEGVKWGFIGVGIFLLVLSIVLFMFFKCR